MVAGMVIGVTVEVVVVVGATVVVVVVVVGQVTGTVSATGSVDSTAPLADRACRLAPFRPSPGPARTTVPSIGAIWSSGVGLAPTG